MKNILLLFLVLFSLGMNAQNNKVKFINVKRIYDFQSGPNEFRLNSALKHKLENLGYTVYYDAEMPMEVRLDPCTEYTATLVDGKSSLTTELTLIIKDCKGNTVFSNKGISRLKMHNKSYMDAFQNIFTYSNIGRLKINQ